MKHTVLITGASAGIGRACAVEFAKHSHDLVLVARNAAALDALHSELETTYGISVRTIPMDLLQPDAPVRLLEEVQKQNLSVDILINNAGYGDFAPFLDSDWEKQRSMVQLNITALMQMTYLFGNAMRKRGQGRIVNLSSVAAFYAGPYMSVYYASKAFVLSFTQAVAEELKGSGVTLTAVCPGPTATNFDKAADMGKSNMFTFRKPQTAESVAQAVYKSCMKGKVICYHSAVTKVSNIATRLLPRSAACKLAMKINGTPEVQS